jgi:hypothetical protein
MAMSATTLKTAIKTRMATEGFNLSQAPLADKFVDILAEEIISHIQTNAVVSTSVSTTVAVTSVSGVTTGPGVSGPGAGTGAGSGTGTIA